MKTAQTIGPVRPILAVLPPAAALVLQSLFWPVIEPYAWFLFYPAVFFSSAIGGLTAGLLATVASTALVWWFFIPQAHSFRLESSMALVSIGVFIAVGVLCSVCHGRLRRANERVAEALEAAFEQAAVGIAHMAPDGRWLRANRKLCDIVGYGRGELLGLSVRDITHPDDLDTDLELNRRLLAGEIETYTLDKRYIRKDRRAVWINLTVSLVRDASGAPDYFIKVVEDIGRRKADELALRESRAQLQTVFDNLSEGVVTATLDGELVYWNRAALHMHGFESLEECRGHLSRFADLFTLSTQDGAALPADDWPLARILRGERLKDLELRVRRTDRDWERIYRYGGALARDADGTPLLALVSIEDVTERKHAAQALTESEARAHLILDAAPSGMLVVDAGGRIESANKRAEEVFGYPPDTMRGIVVETLIPERFRNAHGGLRTQYLTAPTPRLMGKGRDLYALQRDGSEFPVEIGLSPVTMEGRRYVIVSVVEIAERKAAEQEILRLNAELERRVDERTAELKGANRELEAFAYAVSHDLRAPLRAMSGFSQALVEDYGEALQGEARVYLDQITVAANRMAELIDGLLTLSRSTRGELRRDRVDLSALAERLLSEQARAEPERRVTWTVEPGMTAYGDAAMIEVIMDNLVGNAWKYTSNTADPRISVYTTQDGGNRMFCVTDNGAGFDMNHTGKLFHPFQRLHRQEEFPGTGIGLATVQRIVHRHGGVIRGAGSPGQGATFCFSLPSTDEGGEDTS